MTRRTIELVAFCTAILIAALAVHAWLASRDEQLRLAATLDSQKQVIDAADASERARQSSLADALAQIEKLKRETQTPAQILAALPKYLQLPRPITLAPSRPSEQGTAASGDNPCRDAAYSATPPGGAAHVECGGLPAAEAGLPPLSPAKSQVEARGFSPAKNDRREAPSALPKAVAKGEGPEQPIGPRHEASPPQKQDSAAAAPCASASDCSAQTFNAPAAEIPSADLKPLFDYVQNCRACQAQLAAAQKNSADDAAKIAALTRERNAAITASKGGSFLRQLRRNAIWFAIGAAGGYIAARH